MSAGCKCNVNQYHGLSPDDIYSSRLAQRSLCFEERSLSILSQIHVYMHLPSRKIATPTKRVKTYAFQKQNVCREVWAFCNYCDIDLLRKLQNHYEERGIEKRSHGLSRRVPKCKQTINADDIVAIVNFIDCMGRRYGIPHPGSEKVFLESNITAKKIFWLFQSHYTKQVSRFTFRRIWVRYRPLLQRMTPRVDVCPECEFFRDQIRTANSVSRVNQDEDIPSDEENISEVILQFQAQLT